MSVVYVEPDRLLDLQTPSGGQPEREHQTVSLAVPRKGHVLSTVAEQYGAPMRRAAALLADAVSAKAADAVWHRHSLANKVFHICYCCKNSVKKWVERRNVRL